MRPLTRRSFYLNACAAASALHVAGANDRIRVGIVGLGGRGSDHLKHFLIIQDAQVAALCDVNQAARAKAQAAVIKHGAEKAREFVNMREMFSQQGIDAVSIATPNHWHALATAWASHAGKDVYVEKPATHNIHEGYRLVEIARSTGRIVQTGHQRRSAPHRRRAIELLHGGLIGRVYTAKGVCFKRRKSIGKTPMGPVPPGVDWDIFLGPAQWKEYSHNRFAYNWHWFWDTGNGEIGNQGIHEMDVCRWALGEAPLPRTISSTGGKFVYDDDQETPNTQTASLLYPDGRQILFEVRGLLTSPEGGIPIRPGNNVGNLFLGSEGWMWVDDAGFHACKGESNERIAGETPAPMDPTPDHFRNFLDACRSRNPKDLRTGIELGATSAALVHMTNISYRVGRTLQWDDTARRFVKDDEANGLLTRKYRKSFEM